MSRHGLKTLCVTIKIIIHGMKLTNMKLHNMQKEPHGMEQEQKGNRIVNTVSTLIAIIVILYGFTAAVLIVAALVKYLFY